MVNLADIISEVRGQKSYSYFKERVLYQSDLILF